MPPGPADGCRQQKVWGLNYLRPLFRCYRSGLLWSLFAGMITLAAQAVLQAYNLAAVKKRTATRLFQTKYPVEQLGWELSPPLGMQRHPRACHQWLQGDSSL